MSSSWNSRPASNRDVYKRQELEFLETTEVSYRCYCSRERVKGALISLGKGELEEIARAGETVHIGCQFCDADYQFGPEEIQKLLLEL